MGFLKRKIFGGVSFKEEDTTETESHGEELEATHEEQSEEIHKKAPEEDLSKELTDSAKSKIISWLE